ncbi:tribbles homolog 2-like [Osmerus mordax]|uniref:tribbles homolog 2-like n=1 Tax=Osmerus mordax TaxID=8014 RepID=UPI00350EEFB1
MEDCLGSISNLPIRVGRYLLKKKLGDGIFKAVDAHSGHEVVCKVLDYTRYREALCTYSQLPAHPNINQVLDVILGEARSFVFFPRSFGNLHALLRTCRRLHEDTARILFRQLVSAVAHCHSHGLVLRDIKLKTFVFKNKERTVLMLESVEDAVLKQGGDYPLSTNPSPYTSPEMLQATEEADRGMSGPVLTSTRSADVWALGVMLHAMLLGRYPERTGLTGGGVVSPHARCMIRSALHSNPAFRLSASELLTHPWLSSQPRPLPTAHTRSHTHDQTVPT